MQQENIQHEQIKNSYPYVFDNIEMVYCPMCQEVHENNTLCQRND